MLLYSFRHVLKSFTTSAFVAGQILDLIVVFIIFAEQKIASLILEDLLFFLDPTRCPVASGALYLVPEASFSP